MFLLAQVETVARELSTDAFNKYKNDVNQRIFELINAEDSNLKIGGVLAIGELVTALLTCIDALIDFEGEENATKVTRFAAYLRQVLPGNDPQVMQLASKAVGHLALASGTYTTEFVESEVKRALEWLRGDRSEIRRHAAVLILRELASNAPTLIYPYVQQYLDGLWNAIRDQKTVVREAAADALRSCLELLYHRESTQRVSWYSRMLQEAEKGIKSNHNESIHGSLLTYRELLIGTGMFMSGEYTSVCEGILKFKDHKDSLIKRTVISLIPILATYNPLVFSQNYLDKVMAYLMQQLKKNEKDAVFVAIGDVAVAVKSDIEPYLESIVRAIKEGLAQKGKVRAQQEKVIYHCISQLAVAVGQALSQHSHDLLDLMLASTLTAPLCHSLANISAHVLPLRVVIKERLLNVLCIILSGHPYRAPGDPRHKDRERERAISGSSSSLRENEPSKDVATIILALETLAEFEYSGFMLHELIRDWVVTYTDDDNPDVRKAAAKATCAILQKDPILLQTSKQALEVVDQILGRLLSVAISDPDPSIRELVLKYTGEEFDRHLVQADNLRALFLAINDEVFSVRMIAMKHVGRLVDKNPAYVIPQLRRTLIQILTEIEYSNVSRNKEEAAKLLSMLISSSQYYVKPYVESILKALLPKATDPSPGVSASVLSAIGHLASIGCEALVPYLRQLMPIILDGLNDLSSNIKREAALVTLGQLCSNTGYVIAPYLEYPNLLHSLIKILKSEQSVTLRRETQRVLGVLGALDPYRQVRGSEMDEAEDNLSDVSLMLTISPSSEEYLPSVAINALMKILKDPTLSAYHTPAIQAFMYIFKTLGMKCVPFLPQIMPVFLGVMRQVPPAVLEFHFQQLGNLVSIVKHNIRNYLADIFSLIRDFWNPNSSLQTTILSLVEAIAQVMENEFKVYLPNLLTHMLQICEADVQEKRSSALKVLHVLVVFGASLQEYLHLVVPVLCRLLERSEAPQNIRRAVIESIGKMGRRVNFTDHSSRIIHSLVRVLAGPFSDIKSAAMDTLCILVIQLGNRYTIFSETVNRILERQRLQHANYSGLMHNLYTGSPLPSITDLFGEERDDTKSHEAAAVDTGMIKKLTVSQQHLKRAWETSQRSTREDWLEWIRRLSVELLQQSPSHALRACASLASVYHPLARELFNAAFVSCWTELYDQNQDELMQSIESALRSSNIPPEILNTLLNLAEFMEHDDKTLPIDARTLGTYAAKCHAYAKALHYREAEFINNQSTQMVESLISINNQLQQPDTAIGILTYAQQKLNFELKESWYEKLLRWEDALAAYERKQIENPKSFELTLGRMRCLHELGEWETLSKLCTEKWDFADDDQRRAIAPLAASAAWGMSEWENMDNYIVYMKQPSPNRAFFRAIHLIHRNDFEPAQELINKTRALLDTELSAVLSESYSRAYAYLSNFVLMCVG